MIKLSVSLNGETYEEEFADEKELISTADKLKKLKEEQKLRFKSPVHESFYNMIQGNADGYRKNLSKGIKDEKDLGFLKKTGNSTSTSAKQPKNPNAKTSTTSKVPNSTKQTETNLDTKNLGKRKYEEALVAAKAEAKEYQETITRLKKELEAAHLKHNNAQREFEKVKREYMLSTLTMEDFYSFLGSLHDLFDTEERF